MKNKTKIGIVICDRYSNCAGGKCFRAMQNKEGAFHIYKDDNDLELVGYTTCGGCPGGNIEYTPEEMMKNGAEVIHFATGFVVGYPPCPYIDNFRKFIEQRYKVKVVIGTHPIPQKYYLIHTTLGTWESEEWKRLIQPTLTDEQTRLDYD
jgi:predicted metal-binding protein